MLIDQNFIIKGYRKECQKGSQRIEEINNRSL
jgi:hypothetical protein